MKFSIKIFFSKYDQLQRKLRIWWKLLNKSLMKNFIFYAVKYTRLEWIRRDNRNLNDYNGTQTHNHLVCKGTLNNLGKLAFLTSSAKRLSVRLWSKWLLVWVPLQSLQRYLLWNQNKFNTIGLLF